MVNAILIGVLFVSFVWSNVHGNPIKTAVTDHPDGCLCEKFSCGCCAYLDVPQIYLNDTACISFAYDPNAYGISFIFSIDDKAIINETISARNPPPICFPAPLIEDFVDICVHFTDLDITNTKFHGCVQLEARMWWIYVVAEYKLGCFDTTSLDSSHSTESVAVNYASGNNTKLMKELYDFHPLPVSSHLNGNKI